MSANTSCDKFEDKAEDQAPPLAFHPALPLKPLSLGPAGEHVLSNKPQTDKRCHLTSADRSDPNQFSVQAWHPIMSGIWFDMYLAVKAKCSPPPLPHLTPIALYVRMWHPRCQLWLQVHRARGRWVMTAEAVVPGPSLAPAPASCLHEGSWDPTAGCQGGWNTTARILFPCLSTFHHKLWSTQCDFGYQKAISPAGRTQRCMSVDTRSPRTQ